MQLLEFAEGGWRSRTPVPRIRSPISPSGRALGKLRMWVVLHSIHTYTSLAVHGCVCPTLLCWFMLTIRQTAMQILRIPHHVKNLYKYLHHEKKFGVLTLLAGFLSLPIMFGKHKLAVDMRLCAAACITDS